MGNVKGIPNIASHRSSSPTQAGYVRRVGHFISLRAVIAAGGLMLACTLLVVVLPRIGVAFAGDNIWTYSGVVGVAHELVTDPVNPGVIYAIVDSKRIVKSTDGGATWFEIADPAWSWVQRIALAPSSSNVLYATTSAGLDLTTDGGLHWQVVFTDTMAFGVAVSPADWREAYLTTCGTSPPCTSTGDNKFVKTTDGGATWFAIGAGLPAEGAWDDIEVAPSAPHILLVHPSGAGNANPVYKSTDAGLNWSALNVPQSANWITFDPLNSNVIYVAACSPLNWKSTDGGATWKPLATLPQPCGRFIVDPDNIQVIHSPAGNLGVYESLDGGQTWTAINQGLSGSPPIQDIAIGSRTPLKIFAGIGSAGIWEFTQTTVQDYSITINDAALFTNQTAVTLTLTAPPGTTQMEISNDGGFGGATWEAFASTKPWTLTSYGSYVIPRTVYAKFKNGGQISGEYQDDIVLDQTPPTGTIQITGTVANLALVGPTASTYPSAILSTATTTYTTYLPLVGKNFVPGYRAVGLLLSATDDLSGVGSMLISNDAAFANAQWQACVTQLDWLVRDTGATTVYVKYRDRAGNVSSVYSATTTAP